QPLTFDEFVTRLESFGIIADETTVRKEQVKLGAVTFGGVRGRIESMSRRGRLQFTLYDALTDRGVQCYLAAGMEDAMREVWGKLAIVEGIVHRDPVYGRPITVREVRGITIIPEQRMTLEY